MTLPSGQRGFSLVAVIFLITVLAGLAVFMAAISTVQHTTGALELRSARAFYAAKAGMEWASYKAVVDGTCTSPAFTVQGFAVDVVCQTTAHQIRGDTMDYYAISVMAERGGFSGPDFVARAMRGRVAVE